MKYKNIIRHISSLTVIALVLIFFTMCEDKMDYNPGVTPVMQTSMPLNITSYSAEFKTYALTGGGTISEVAYYYMENSDAFDDMAEEELIDYIWKNGQKINASYSDSCLQKVEGLQAETTYQVISFGKNEYGESVGVPVSFTTNATNQLPELEVSDVFEEVGDAAASATFEVVNVGFDYLAECGVVWANEQYPTIENGTKVIRENQQQGAFEFVLDDIEKFTKYYLRAYAIDQNGIVTYSTDNLLVMLIDPTFTDPRDGTVYTVSLYGEDIWMTENFKYLPETMGGSVGPWVPNYEGTSVEEAKATDEYDVFGCLYPLGLAIELAPEGWHLATDEEWKKLEALSGMAEDKVEILGDDWSRYTDGTAFKFMLNMTGQTRWSLDGGWSSNANNSIDFNLVPAGRQWCGNAFQNFGVRVHIWTAKEGHPTDSGILREIAPWGAGIYRNELIYPCVGMSARYVHD